MQGTFIVEGGRIRRPASKKALKEAIAAEPRAILLEATSVFGNEYDGPLSEAPEGTYYVVGPDPHTSRKWYAQIIKSGGKLVVK